MPDRRVIGLTDIVYGEDVPDGQPPSSIDGYNFQIPDAMNPGNTRSINGGDFEGTPFMAPGDITETFGRVEGIRIQTAGGEEIVPVIPLVRFIRQDGITPPARVTFFVPTDGRAPFKLGVESARTSWVIKPKA